jgi:hypothetical protein
VAALRWNGVTRNQRLSQSGQSEINHVALLCDCARSLQNCVQKLRLRWAILEWRRCYALNRDPPESGAQAQPRSVRKYEWRWACCRPVFHIARKLVAPG